jgi:biopolymer transport protein ExbB
MQSFNVLDMWGHMGGLDKVVVSLLALMSVYSIWVMIDRSLAFRRAASASRTFVALLRENLTANDITGALTAAKIQDDAPVAKVVFAALTEYQHGVGSLSGPGGELDLDVVDALNREIARAKEIEVAGLKRGLGGLASISSAAPFIGLFGTVIGIINAFRSMAESGQGGLGAVSAGIAEALFTTATGLLVAIPAVMAFNYFNGRIEEFSVGMNDIAGQMLGHLLRTAKAQKRAA